MPEKGGTLKFTNGSYQLKVPFTIYADFETILEPHDSCENNPDKSYTRKINKHTPSGFCTYSKFAHGDISNPIKLYRGKDCAEVFCDHVIDETKRLHNMFPEKEMKELTEDEKKCYDIAEKCHICDDKFIKWDESKKEDEDFKKRYKKYKKVRDHCHYTGQYRGPAHSICNLKYRLPNHIPIVFHNLSGYDSHLFIHELAEKYNKHNISVIANNYEKYISFSIKVVVGQYKNKKGNLVDKKTELRFIDSFRFMASSLDKLSSNLTDEQCKILKKEYPDNDIFKLMRQKGVYPYEYIDGWSKFDETKLPNKDKFYSKLTKSDITDEQYKHAKKVWQILRLKNIGEYHDVYLKTDVLLLADVFENFRELCLEHYELDPAYFHTAPCLAWQACLKFTGVKLELLTDIDMLLMFERGIRGGIVQAVTRYAEGNNTYMGDKYGFNKVISYI